MGFRIMQLQYETMATTATIEDGITFEANVIDLGFAEIQSLLTTSEESLKVTNIHEYVIENKQDGFKKIKINPPSLSEVTNEEGILLIIRYVDCIERDKQIQKLAGRYPGEGIYLLKPNDKVKLTKYKLTEEFAALQFENKMYLVKVH